MADILFIKNNRLIEFVSKSIEMGAYEIEKLNTKEEITVIKDGVGYEIAKYDSNSKEASGLRKQLLYTREKTRNSTDKWNRV